MADLEIVADALDGRLGAPLAAALGAEIEVRYAGVDDVGAVGPDPVFEAVAAEQLAPPAGTFLVALLDGEPVGCGGIRPYPTPDRPGTAELKRMYVAPEARGAGVGRALLAALEAAAADLGYRAIVLETGLEQPEAMALYESAGWRVVPNYGAWRHSALTRCYELELPGS